MTRDPRFLHLLQNGNGVYDFEAAGASDLDPNLPQEATVPANCGTIEPVGG